MADDHRERDETFKFQLGEKLTDVVTGFEGYCIGRTDWWGRTSEYKLQPRMDRDRFELPEAKWFDEPRLVRSKPSPAEYFRTLADVMEGESSSS